MRQPVKGGPRARLLARRMAGTVKPVVARAEQLQAQGQQPTGGQSGDGGAAGPLGDAGGAAVAVRVRELYPGAVGPLALLDKMVRLPCPTCNAGRRNHCGRGLPPLYTWR